jgi:hypothetical protein
MSGPRHKIYDVAVVGGGMVGASLACILGEALLLGNMSLHINLVVPRCFGNIKPIMLSCIIGWFKIWCDYVLLHTGASEITKHLAVALLDRQVSGYVRYKVFPTHCSSVLTLSLFVKLQ